MADLLKLRNLFIICSYYNNNCLLVRWINSFLNGMNFVHETLENIICIHIIEPNKKWQYVFDRRKFTIKNHNKCRFHGNVILPLTEIG